MTVLEPSASGAPEASPPPDRLNRANCSPIVTVAPSLPPLGQ
jgi:hypothetical protein